MKRSQPKGTLPIAGQRPLPTSRYQLKNYKRANGILQMGKTYGSGRLNKACKRACDLGEHKYTLVKNILLYKQEDLELDFDQLNDQTPHIPAHDNIRGANYYQWNF